MVESYARYDHMDLTVPDEWGGGQHSFLPDFVVRLTDGAHLLLEVKGFESEQDRQKYESAKRWCEAVTTWGEMGRWEFRDCRGASKLPGILAEVSGVRVALPA